MQGRLLRDRLELRTTSTHPSTTPMLLWTAALATVPLVNASLVLAQGTAGQAPLSALRILSVGAAITLTLPAVQRHAEGPPARALTAAMATWYVAATSLWLIGSLTGPGTTSALAADPVLTAAIHLVPVAGVAVYVGVLLASSRLSPTDMVLAATGALSAALLVVASLMPETVISNLLAGLWCLPVVVALQATVSRRLANEHARLATRLRRAGHIDALTGLPTRAALDEYLASELAAGQRPALLQADIEGLKHTNDRHGHAGGDRLLAHTAAHLTRELGPDVYVARTGGDEFSAVLPGRMSADELRALARRLRDGLTAPTDLHVRPRLTIGIAHAACDSPVELERHADLAAVEARETHAGVTYFDDRLRAREESRAAVHADLERAVAEGRIIAHFQPVADTATLQVIGVEALARWQDGDTLRAPASWLPLAEETGLIVEIGAQMFAAARAASDRYGLPVAVNVAARQLDEPDVLGQIERSWGDGAWERLTIEVTESALAHDDHHVRAVLTELAGRGVRIALDDFGTGYNSLARLGALPLHVLKIDKSLVDSATSDAGLAVLRAVVGLAEAHGLEVVAEGVEQRSQLHALLGLGVDLVQGNLVGRPRAELPERTSAAPTQRVRVQPVPRVTPA